VTVLKNGSIRISQKNWFIMFRPLRGLELVDLCVITHGLTPVAKNVSPAARAANMKALWNRDKQPPQGAKLPTSHGR